MIIFLGESTDSDMTSTSSENELFETSSTSPNVINVATETTQSTTKKLPVTLPKLNLTTISTSTAVTPTKNQTTVASSTVMTTKIPSTIRTTLVTPNITVVVPKTTYNFSTSTKALITPLKSTPTTAMVRKSIFYTTRPMKQSITTSRISTSTYKQTLSSLTTDKSKPTEEKLKITKRITNTTPSKSIPSTTQKSFTKFSTNNKTMKYPITYSQSHHQQSTPSKVPFVRTKSTQYRYENTTWKPMFQSSGNKVSGWQFMLILLSSIVLIFILMSLTLITWKRYRTNKWNQYNSHQIEYKSNHYGGAEESLVRSNSFIIDDSFNRSLIDEFDGDEIQPLNLKKNELKPKSTATNRIKSKTTAVAATNKIKRTSDRLGKKCDQYSEKRCLTADTTDDEQFDFTIRSNI